MKKLIYLLIAFSLTLTFSSCEKDDEVTPNVEEQTLTVNGQTYMVNDTMDTYFTTCYEQDYNFEVANQANSWDPVPAFSESDVDTVIVISSSPVDNGTFTSEGGILKLSPPSPFQPHSSLYADVLVVLNNGTVYFRQWDINWID